ncbi:hypothetical protein ABB37_02336 [Leptomonas pyrrhocoris]|uniref:Uncharacterized protein n=1 Tax=Leptomonas pyrrhocoris TaxID=157538 RepID=A0A0M9G7S4_LEPPY|nr:hypothetical protein ABB37_02336 [Leptomonas pyrrhocoris]KPA84327.1 hypothetical protein ABB37_02336 [Leptomonas pyrrhocoris]|eukprot:XP_015662766.1 hypothetical protein ABB37_02336 [Leptomonas pyrrhocoris]
MRCAAAVFLTNSAGADSDARRCNWQSTSAFPSPPLPVAGPPAAHHAETQSCAGGQKRARSPRSYLAQGAQGEVLLAKQSSHTTVGVAGSVGRSSHAPRPVTVRQLYAAVLGTATEPVRCPATRASKGKVPSDAVPRDNVLAHRCFNALPSRCGACDDVTSEVCAARLQRLPSTSSRIGESTILLDGAACHVVVVCGRVVRYEVAAASAAAPVHTPRLYPPTAPFAATPSYDVIWITDNTGLLCVLRPRSGQARRQRTEEDALEGSFGSSLPYPFTDAGHRHMTLAQDSAWSPFSSTGEFRTLQSEGDAAAVRVNDTCHPAQLSTAAPATSGSAPMRHPRPEVPRTGSGYTASNVIDCLDAEFDKDESDERFYVNDYVVCTGVLAFADVEVHVAAALRRDAAALRGAALAAITSTVSENSAHPTTNTAISSAPQNAGDCTANSTAKDQKDVLSKPCTTYVLLPGSEVPLRLDAVQTEVGIVGPLPPQTRYLSEREARQQWGAVAGEAEEGAARDEGEQHAPTTEAGRSSHRHVRRSVRGAFDNPAEEDEALCGGGGGGDDDPTPAATTAASLSSVPLMCIKGRPRLLTDSNEYLYWWLSATETHLRLTAMERR